MPRTLAAVRSSACRLCAGPLDAVFADLGMSPFANSFVPIDKAGEMEPYYPLRALVCPRCFLVQLEEFESPATIFGDYAYFSSYSTSWLEHCERFVDNVTTRFGLDATKYVIEVASNDGYLLQYFVNRGVPVLGIEPAANVADVARQRGIPTIVEFVGAETAKTIAEDRQADLVVANNVLAHTPDLHDFVEGLRTLLAPDGVLTLEFPHLLRLIAERQFDTIYHEHFSYFSLRSARRVLADHGLHVFDVEQLPTHGGSLRVFACHEDRRSIEASVDALLGEEQRAGLDNLATYLAFADQVRAEKRAIVSTLFGLKDLGARIIGYGAPAKGNTLLNYCGIGRDVIDFTVDLNPSKQNNLLPGSHIPIRPVEAIDEARPDIVLILPWNLRDEIIGQLSRVRSWGGRFAARCPEMTILP